MDTAAAAAAAASTRPPAMVPKVGQRVAASWEVRRVEVKIAPMETRWAPDTLCLVLLLSWRGVKTYGKETMRPVTIKQIIDACVCPKEDKGWPSWQSSRHQPHPDSDFKIDDVEVTQVYPPLQQPPWIPAHSRIVNLHWTNQRHLCPSHKHNLQSRWWNRPDWGKAVGRQRPRPRFPPAWPQGRPIPSGLGPFKAIQQQATHWCTSHQARDRFQWDLIPSARGDCYASIFHPWTAWFTRGRD